MHLRMKLVVNKKMVQGTEVAIIYNYNLYL